MNNGDSGETVFTFEGVLSERDPEQWDKLRKVQPKNECEFYYFFFLKKKIEKINVKFSLRRVSEKEERGFQTE